MQHLSQTKIEQVLNLVEMRGFFLKRSYPVKLDLAKEIKEELGIHATGEDFLNYLESLKPVKPKAKREVIPTFAGQVKRVKQIALLFMESGSSLPVPRMKRLFLHRLLII